MDTGVAPGWWAVLGQRPFLSESLAIFAKMEDLGLTTTARQRYLLNQHIADFMEIDIWGDWDAYWGFGSSALGINWKDPDNFLAVATGDYTWEAFAGFTSAGGHIDTGLNPAVDAVRYTRNDGGFFCVTAPPSFSSTALDVGTTGGTLRGGGRSGASMTSRTNSGTSLAAPLVANSVGLSYYYRTDADNQSAARDDATPGTDVAASAAITSSTLKFGAGIAGASSPRTILSGGIGRAPTPEKIAALYLIENAYPE